MSEKEINKALKDLDQRLTILEGKIERWEGEATDLTRALEELTLALDWQQLKEGKTKH